MRLTDQVYAELEQRYAADGRAQRAEWIHRAVNLGYDDEIYSLGTVRGALTRLVKSGTVSSNGEYYSPTVLSNAVIYVHPQTAASRGLVSGLTPSPGYLCRLCGCVVAARDLHDRFHAEIA